MYRRLRKDYAHLSIISIRRSLMEKIRDAVKKENNIIGTFYRNCGVHYREAESAEYETSPIVVVHNPVFYGYGGYEGATVYELFINGNGKLLCTLNGEAGEDFDEPAENVQTEGLLNITHWLEEYGFIPMILMTTRLPYATSAVQTISRHRHGWTRIPAYSLALRALTVMTTGVTNARIICPLPRLKNLRDVCRNGGIRWIQIRWRRLQATVRTSVGHL
ncbi:hypothetical protein NIB75_19435 [Bacteroides uniformis]|nr:hypothetical protein [Bacteroides uniformis]